MVELIPMDEAEFQTYMELALPQYAEEHVRNGSWSVETAQKRAEEQFVRLLPDGLATKNHYFYTIRANGSGDKAGIIWFAIEHWGGIPQAFVYDVLIEPRFRRKGYALQAFQVLERIVHDLGLRIISLHVFGHNRAALQLYEKLGFEITDIAMAKRLG